MLPRAASLVGDGRRRSSCGKSCGGEKMTASGVRNRESAPGEHDGEVRLIVAQLGRLLVQRQRLVHRLEALPDPSAGGRRSAGTSPRDQLLRELASLADRQTALLDTLAGLIPAADATGAIGATSATSATADCGATGATGAAR